MKNKLYGLVLLCCFLSIAAYPQTYSFNLSWHKPYELKTSSGIPCPFLYFEGAIVDNNCQSPPVFFNRIPLATDNSFDISLKNTTTKPLTEDEIKAIGSLTINDDFLIEKELQIERKKPWAGIFITPIRKKGNSYEKLISFDIELIVYPSKKIIKAGKGGYAQNSVLATGSWYKLRLKNTGIYKIGYDELSNMGIDVNAIDPRNIGIYGNRGGMLPESNNAFRYDDLAENAIFISGENDGKLDSNDYILFYGQSPTTWKYDPATKHFRHTNHLYSDYTYYFLTTDLGPGKRIQLQPSSPLSPTHQVTKFNDYATHENDQLNLLKTGSEWYGEKFDAIKAYSFSFSFPFIDPSSPVHLRAELLARSTTNSSFDVKANGNPLTLTLPPVVSSYLYSYAKVANDTLNFLTSNPKINVNISYIKPTQNSVGWLNYIEINAIRQLKYTGSQMPFRNVSSVGTGNIAEYIVQNASSAVKIWDVTDPVNIMQIDATLSGSDLIFKMLADTLKEYLAFNGTGYYTPTFVEKVPNQNLHGLGQHDMIIVSHPAFLSQAYKLADLHANQDNMSVVVVTPQQIYNEFSSGAPDATAIRSFAKMMYDRTTGPDDMLLYLLLFGDGSYDNKNRLPGNTNFILSWQTKTSLDPIGSHTTDDYFGLLDDNEGAGANGTLDIGIGRFPVKSVSEADVAIDKITRYTQKNGIANNQGCVSLAEGISNLADWRNVVCFIADDEDYNLHLSDAESLAAIVETNFKDYNVDKIYFDAYKQVTNSGGQRYPEANEAINKRVEKGALLVNYTGHGGEVGWSLERVLEISDINNWKNKNNLPVFVTATCEFSRFDDPARTSAGELVFLNPNGGAVALFSTSRLSLSSTNFTLNRAFIQKVFVKSPTGFPAMGDVIRQAKVANGSSYNNRNFVLLGDPALRLAYPQYNVTTTHFNGNPVSAAPDTLKALSKVTIEGAVVDDIGNTITSYNGILYPTVFDKRGAYKTKGNDSESFPANFSLQKNIIYKGKASVDSGKFSFTFIVPKDIAYKYGEGRISYYAENGKTDANGYFENFIIGGSADDAPEDKTGPEIKLYLNNENFVFGGITDESPVLLAFVNDSNGINTVGSGIGHDIVAVLDNNTDKSYVLNDYYEADLNSYKSGAIRYPFTELTEGNHTLSLKVWDVYNNSSETTTEFVVAKSAEVALDHVLNYPNPFTTSTSFFFEHNQPCCELDVQIQIFTITGKLIKTLDARVETNGYRAEPIHWDGRDDFDDPIGRGVYIYKLQVRNKDGKTAEKLEKLVILK